MMAVDEKLRKGVQFILRGTWIYVLKFMEIHWDISLSTRNVNLVELEGKSEDHQSP